jgi:hypothetical protein
MGSVVDYPLYPLERISFVLLMAVSHSWTLTCPRLCLLIQGKLDGDVADAHKTREETFVECSEAFCPVYSRNGIECVFVPC